MTFSEFLSVYGETILSLITGVLTATGITAFFNEKVQAFLSKNDRAQKITEVVEAVVGLAERQSPALTGEEKLDFAVAQASDWLASVDISVSEAELRIAIEKAVNLIQSATTKTKEQAEVKDESELEEDMT